MATMLNGEVSSEIGRLKIPFPLVPANTFTPSKANAVTAVESEPRPEPSGSQYMGVSFET